MISLIVAVAENGIIGNANQLIWRLPNDLKRFKELTWGHHILMGRRTFESIGKVLPGRTTVILTKQKGYQVEGAEVFQSLNDAIEFATVNNDDEIFIIGGGEIYRQSINLADRIYYTKVFLKPAGDTCFPKLDMNVWKEVECCFFELNEANSVRHAFITYERKE